MLTKCFNFSDLPSVPQYEPRGFNSLLESLRNFLTAIFIYKAHWYRYPDYTELDYVKSSEFLWHSHSFFLTLIFKISGKAKKLKENQPEQVNYNLRFLIVFKLQKIWQIQFLIGAKP